ncbi:hypothetical protein AB0I49_21810 [Streptomyces sp. NPDC050617]|uniref:hypothetical protein n=1 Tax=Streptomyces sp. NPDC050617 TaxID=3154628 RepID=UPI00344739BA
MGKDDSHGDGDSHGGGSHGDSGSHGGGTYKITDGVLRDWADRQIPQFAQALHSNPDYAKLGEYGSTNGSMHLKLGAPDRFLASKNLGNLSGKYFTDLHARLESAIQVFSNFSTQLDHVDQITTDAEISASALAQDLMSVLGGGSGAGGGANPLGR